MPSKEQLEQEYGLEVSTTPTNVPDKSIPLKGRYVTLTQWKQDYVPTLWKYMQADPLLLIYMPSGDINSEDDLREEFKDMEGSDEPICYAILADPEYLNPKPGVNGGPHTEVIGVAFYGHTSTKDRAIEVGAMFTPIMQQTAASTEVHYLLLKHVLDDGSPILGANSPPYRRVTWLCNRLNTKSRNSALRVGYVYEGTLRQVKIVKGRTRDDDIFSMLDSEWPANKAALEGWLGAGNWDSSGKQVKKLQQVRAALGELART